MSEDKFNPDCPMMGFWEEQYIPAHGENARDTGWTRFYTCIANGKRVYVWAYQKTGRGDSHDNTCVMVSDHVSDPAYKAGIAEIQHMFADQHTRQKAAGKRRTHYAPADPIMLQAFIHHITLGGNENVEPETYGIHGRA